MTVSELRELLDYMLGRHTVLVHTRQGTASHDGPVSTASSGQLATAAEADLRFGVALRS